MALLFQNRLRKCVAIQMESTARYFGMMAIIAVLSAHTAKPEWKNCRRGNKCTWVDYAATHCEVIERDWNWEPSIFMPRWASRITLEITSIRVERVQDITEEDAIAEGIELNPEIEVQINDGSSICKTANGFCAPQYAFALLWSTVNKKPGRRWADNPWVWVVEFKKL